MGEAVLGGMTNVPLCPKRFGTAREGMQGVLNAPIRKNCHKYER
jgi:hypothetical protein